MHRKQGKAGFWQAVRLAGFLVVLGFVLGFTFGSAAHWVASARPAAATVAQRPVWDGRTPRVWVGAADPVCPVAVWRESTHGTIGDVALGFSWARSGAHGPVFAVECEPDGGEYVWAAVPRGD